VNQKLFQEAKGGGGDISFEKKKVKVKKIKNWGMKEDWAPQFEK